MGEKEAFDTFLECPKCHNQYPPDSGRKIGAVSYCSNCYKILKPESPKKVCESCGKMFPETTMTRDEEGLLYCKKCYKLLTSTQTAGIMDKGRAQAASQPFSTSPIVPSSLAITIEAPALADAIGRSVSQAFANPIRIEFAPVKLELVGGGGIAVPTQVPVPVVSPVPTAIPVAAIEKQASTAPPKRPQPASPARSRPYVDASILRIMGAKRLKWRPAELAAELKLLDQPVDATEDDVVQAIERLSRDMPGADAAEQVVQLSTRFIRRDLFIVEDEINFIDLLILKILKVAGNTGTPATGVFTFAEMFNLVPISLPTVLNHLRALKAPGWELVGKVGIALRDNYAITEKGFTLLAEAEDAALGNYTNEWRERLERMGIITPKNTFAEKADLLLASIPEIIKRHARDADLRLMKARINKEQIDPAIEKLNARKITALKSFGL